jgi:hypothetical protein
MFKLCLSFHSTGTAATWQDSECET